METLLSELHSSLYICYFLQFHFSVIACKKTCYEGKRCITEFVEKCGANILLITYVTNISNVCYCRHPSQ